VYSESFVPGDPSTVDKYGHGSHVAGIIAGNAALSSTGVYSFRGMGESLERVNLRVLDANGAGTDGAVLAAIDRAIQLKDTLNIRVINLSLGRPVRESWSTDPLCRAVANAWQKGIVVVVAAGNDGRNNLAGTQGYGTINSPGNHPLAITVGALNDRGTLMTGDDVVASYSSKGPSAIDKIVKPDIVAPGNRIISLMAVGSTLAMKSTSGNLVPLTYYQQTTLTGTSKDYFRLSGTSMAAPMVAGAAAILIAREPTLSPDSVKVRLMRSARKNFPTAPASVVDASTGTTYTVRFDRFSVGAGYLDIWAALARKDIVPAGVSAASMRAVRTSTGTVAFRAPFVSGSNIIWGGEDQVWGSNIIWGGEADAVWGNNIIWGGEDVIAGTNIIWGGDDSFAALSTRLQGER
jgi:serine protease AprX